MSELAFTQEGFEDLLSRVVGLCAGERAVAGMVMHGESSSYAIFGATVEPPTITQVLRKTVGRPHSTITRVSLYEDGMPQVETGLSANMIAGDPVTSYDEVTVSTKLREPHDYDDHVALYNHVGDNVEAFISDPVLS